MKNTMVAILEVKSDSAVPSMVRNIANCARSSTCGVISLLCCLIEFPIYKFPFFVFILFCDQPGFVYDPVLSMKGHLADLVRVFTFIFMLYVYRNSVMVHSYDACSFLYEVLYISASAYRISYCVGLREVTALAVISNYGAVKMFHPLQYTFCHGIEQMPAFA